MKLLLELPEIERLYVYHPDIEKLRNADVGALSPAVVSTSDPEALHGADAVLITSPNRTHVGYIRSLLDKVPYIYCEKPPAASGDELDYLDSLQESDKRRVYFNFNYRCTELALAARDYLASGVLGNPVHFSFVSTHGLAYRDSFSNDWRSKAEDQLSGIFGNVSIHYIDLCIWLLGEFSDVRVQKTAWSENSQSADSVHTLMSFPNGCSASIFASYAAPFMNQAQLIFNDGFMQLDDGRLALYSPRDSFDEGGRFVEPPSKELVSCSTSREYYDASLRRSLRTFIGVAAEEGSFSVEDFDRSLKSNAVIFEY